MTASRLLCRLGIHAWGRFYGPWYGGQPAVRECVVCDRSERWQSRAAWQFGRVVTRGEWVKEQPAPEAHP